MFNREAITSLRPSIQAQAHPSPRPQRLGHDSTTSPTLHFRSLVRPWKMRHPAPLPASCSRSSSRSDTSSPARIFLVLVIVDTHRTQVSRDPFVCYSLLTHDVECKVSKGRRSCWRARCHATGAVIASRQDHYVLCVCVFILRSGPACRIRTNESSNSKER